MRNISFIIPHYQKQDTLPRVLRELGLQLHPNDQVMVVDDHSPDGLPEVGDCGCIEIIRPPKHTPHIYRLNTLRNHGLKNARYDCVVVLDPDCQPNPHFTDYARRLYDPAVLYGGKITYLREDGYTPDPRESHFRSKSNWVDRSDSGGYRIWGGCMMFSKRRAYMVGGFDEDYNGGWGCDDNDFAIKMYHSGVRLRYSPRLHVLHLDDYPEYGGYQRNRRLGNRKTELYRRKLDGVTPYKPRVLVQVTTLHRPKYLSQCLMALFRQRIPVRVLLQNQMDDTDETLEEVDRWRHRWCINYVYNHRVYPLGWMKHFNMKHACEEGYDYYLTVDDDMTVMPDTLHRLVAFLDKHPEYHAVSGWMNQHDEKRMLGGKLTKRGDELWFQDYAHRGDIGFMDVDYVNGGYTLFRLDPLILFDYRLNFFEEWDYSLTLRERGCGMASLPSAGAWHKILWTSTGKPRKYNGTPMYKRLRYDGETIEHDRGYFKDKWGVTPRQDKEMIEYEYG